MNDATSVIQEASHKLITRVRFNRKRVSVMYYRSYPGNRAWRPIPSVEKANLYGLLQYFNGVSVETGQMAFMDNYLRKATLNYSAVVRYHVVMRALMITGPALDDTVAFLHGNRERLSEVIDLFKPHLKTQIESLRKWVDSKGAGRLTIDYEASSILKKLRHLGLK